jgi:hypothetical protein
MSNQKTKTPSVSSFSREEVWPIKKFLSVPVYEKNRTIEPRIKRMTFELKKNQNERLFEVSVGKAVTDFDNTKSKYKKNDVFCLDGNCRAEVWRRNPSLAPENVLVKIYSLNSKEKADETYFTFDNSKASETSSDKMSGLLREKDYNAKSDVIRYGKMNTFLKKATRYAYDENGLYLLTAPVEKMLNFHWEQVKFLDEYQEIFKKSVKGSCNVYASLLMIGKKYGVTHPRFKMLLDNFCNEVTEVNNKDYVDGVTYVFGTLYGKHKEIWGNNAYSVNKLPLFGKILFSFESFMLGEPIEKNKRKVKDDIFIDYYKDFYESGEE